jgi:hypothetical protein
MSNIWEECKVTGKKFKFMRAFLNHIRTLNMTSQEYYDRFHKTPEEGICYCGKETKYCRFSYKKYCSATCATKSEEHRKSVSERYINNPDALISFRLKRKTAGINVNINKRRETIKNKAKELGLTLEDYYSQHSKKAFLSMTTEDVKKRTLKAMCTKNAKQSFGGRSGYKKCKFFDEYVSLQGYENIVLQSLIEDFKMQKEDILVGKSNIPIIKYGKNKMYFPDFYLPQKNLLIEVKSKYTLHQHLNVVIEKCKACVEQGYSILLLVVNQHEARNRKLEGSKNMLYWAISSQAPNPTWYGEGSTTILLGVDSSESKSSSTQNKG